MEAIQIQEIEAIADLMDQDEDNEAKKVKNQDETHILEKTIINIGALMAVGFGEAGSPIISQNMEKSRVEKPCISKQLLGKNKVTNRKNYHKKSLLASC